MILIMTRIEVGDYEVWKPMFDLDAPGARSTATGHRLFRGLANPNEVFIQVDFDSAEAALAARERLIASRVLERFADRSGPTVVEETEVVGF